MKTFRESCRIRPSDIQLKAVFRVVNRNARVWRKFMVSSLVGNLGQPFMFLLAFGLGMSRQIGAIEGYTYLQFIAPGLAASAVMFSAAFEASYGSYTRLSIQSTFEGILITPITVEELALGEVIWGGLKGLLSGTIMLIVMPFFGLIPSLWVVSLIPVLFVAGIFFSSLGLVMTSLAKSYEFFNYFISLVITPMYLFSGVFFSLSTLPQGTAEVLQYLPLAPVVSLSRMFCYGQFDQWELKLIAIFVLAFANSWLATILLRRRLIG